MRTSQLSNPTPPALSASALCAGVLLLSMAVLGFAAESSPELRLERVQQLILDLQGEMQDTRDQYGKLQHELKQNETAIGQLAHQVELLEQEQRHKQRNLQNYQQQHQQQRQQLDQQQQRLGSQVRAAYIAGRQDYLKILLNQEDPVSLGRVLTYYDYFNRARARNIEQIHATLEHLEILSAQIEAETHGIQELIRQEQAQQQALQQQQQERRAILAQLDVEAKAQDDRLQRLNDDKLRLQQLVSNLHQALGGSAAPDSVFAQRIGHLQLPVEGKVSQRFGDPRGVGNLRWQGLLIRAETGSKVHSVDDGQVVFADWLRNFGQILIVEHDGEFMSLYGHNQSLYKKAGDRVSAGEVIASVGDSGGNQAAGLYFEIRRQGSPVDPLPWFKR